MRTESLLWPRGACCRPLRRLAFLLAHADLRSGPRKAHGHTAQNTTRRPGKGMGVSTLQKATQRLRNPAQQRTLARGTSRSSTARTKRLSCRPEGGSREHLATGCQSKRMRGWLGLPKAESGAPLDLSLPPFASPSSFSSAVGTRCAGGEAKRANEVLLCDGRGTQGPFNAARARQAGRRTRKRLPLASSQRTALRGISTGSCGARQRRVVGDGGESSRNQANAADTTRCSTKRHNMGEWGTFTTHTRGSCVLNPQRAR